MIKLINHKKFSACSRHISENLSNRQRVTVSGSHVTFCHKNNLVTLLIVIYVIFSYFYERNYCCNNAKTRSTRSTRNIEKCCHGNCIFEKSCYTFLGSKERTFCHIIIVNLFRILYEICYTFLGSKENTFCHYRSNKSCQKILGNFDYTSLGSKEKSSCHINIKKLCQTCCKFLGSKEKSRCQISGTFLGSKEKSRCRKLCKFIHTVSKIKPLCHKFCRKLCKFSFTGSKVAYCSFGCFSNEKSFRYTGIFIERRNDLTMYLIIDIYAFIFVLIFVLMIDIVAMDHDYSPIFNNG